MSGPQNLSAIPAGTNVIYYMVSGPVDTTGNVLQVLVIRCERAKVTICGGQPDH